MSSSDGSGKPWCSCCHKHRLTTLDSPGLLEKWSEDEGVKWSWTSDHLAYWHLCHECHHRQWPGDRRVKGRWCSPGLALWSRTSESIWDFLATWSVLFYLILLAWNEFALLDNCKVNLQSFPSVLR